ncbi:MAG TPA: hypothetical protein VJY62_05525 [Bacteroidia bacterium]|nr:hypothetical protein [Bacteroidia bacterium]
MAINIHSPFIVLRTDKEGKIRTINQKAEPYTLDVKVKEKTVPNIAKEYLTDILQIFDLNEDVLTNLNLPPEINLDKDYFELRKEDEKKSQNLSIVFYAQTYFGIPIWRTGISLKIRTSPLEAIGAISTWNYDAINIPAPNNDLLSEYHTISSQELAGLLNIEPSSQVKINKSDSVYIYQYKSAERLNDALKEGFLPEEQTPISLPPVDNSIEENNFYLVREVLFSFPGEGSGLLNWRCFLELNTGSILNLTVFNSSATGMVFLYDPITLGANVDVNDPDTVLDPLQQSVTLLRLENPGGGNQELRGDASTGYAFVIDPIDHPADLLHSIPAEDPPNEPTPYTFNYNSRTANFAAVNAYFYVDRFIALIADLGIALNPDQFPNTVLPLHIDHRALNDGINAQGPGNGAGDASIGIRFGAVSSQLPYLGMGTDYRVTLHEFGHVLLYDHVHGPNFGFSHSYGDSLAAIINDPVSLAADRFSTFPWVNSAVVIADRRHDRSVPGGWAWHGTFDTGGYNSEQILATTLFRIYRSLGGDSGWSVRKQFAERITVLLMLKTVQHLTPFTNPTNPEDFATEMMDADTDLAFLPNVLDTIGLGASHKVVRWGFEKQGAYQIIPYANVEGVPPAVDVYIDDGRAGEYQYLDVFWDTQDIINRRNPDGIFIHEIPLLSSTNYVYVKIKHRGSIPATNVVVKGFHCNPGGGNIWPVDWSPMVTAQINVPGGIIPGQQIIVGPFSWIPTVQGHECLLMIVNADGDMANTETISGNPDWYFVPNDNNVAQRNVAPAPAFHGGVHLAEAFTIYQFCVRNPYQAEVHVNLIAELPPLLVERGWELTFTTPGPEFTLKKFDRKCTLVKMSLRPGQDFTREDVIRTKNRDIVIKIATENGIIGGMTYRLDPDLERYNERE